MKWAEAALWKELDRRDALNSFISIYICFSYIYFKQDFLKKYKLSHRKDFHRSFWLLMLQSLCWKKSGSSSFSKWVSRLRNMQWEGCYFVIWTIWFLCLRGNPAVELMILVAAICMSSFKPSCWYALRLD